MAFAKSGPAQTIPARPPELPLDSVSLAPLHRVLLDGLSVGDTNYSSSLQHLWWCLLCMLLWLYTMLYTICVNNSCPPAISNLQIDWAFDFLNC